MKCIEITFIQFKLIQYIEDFNLSVLLTDHFQHARTRRDRTEAPRGEHGILHCR
jgi:hypothetical protein